MIYARIEDNVVFELLDTDEDITQLYPPQLIWVAASAGVAQGWVYDPLTDSFAPPMVTYPDGWRDRVWEEFRVRRDLYLSRLSEIAGRYSRRGDTVVPPAADTICDGLLNMPQDPILATPTSPDALRTAIVVAAGVLLKAQLTNPATATTIKAALDKVFK